MLFCLSTIECIPGFDDDNTMSTKVAHNMRRLLLWAEIVFVISPESDEKDINFTRASYDVSEPRNSGETALPPPPPNLLLTHVKTSRSHFDVQFIRWQFKFEQTYRYFCSPDNPISPLFSVGQSSTSLWSNRLEIQRTNSGWKPMYDFIVISITWGCGQHFYVKTCEHV